MLNLSRILLEFAPRTAWHNVLLKLLLARRKQIDFVQIHCSPNQHPMGEVCAALGQLAVDGMTILIVTPTMQFA
jgi:ABC-type polar amino acid transport system ATPase subunit